MSKWNSCFGLMTDREELRGPARAIAREERQRQEQSERSSQSPQTCLSRAVRQVLLDNRSSGEAGVVLGGGLGGCSAVKRAGARFARVIKAVVWRSCFLV